MNGNKLNCCVVRDLLPAYIEELTEQETTILIKEHLADCPSCRAVEHDMRAQIPIEKAPKRALRFLKRVKRTRLTAAILSIVVAFGCMLWLYDQEFHYSNTEAGRLAAVEDYVPLPEDSNMQSGVKAGTPLRVVAYAERDNCLYVAYAADNEDNVHGILSLVYGINGKYRPISTSQGPFPYTAGVMGQNMWSKGDNGDKVFALAGDGCREIYAIQVNYDVAQLYSEQVQTYKKSYVVSEPNFLWLINWDELAAEFDIPVGEISRIYAANIELLDKDGQDVTVDYQDETVEQSWGGGKGTAEQFLLYVYMGIVAILGAVFVRYFLRRD